MRFQKRLVLGSLIVAALCFVFAISFLTGGLGNVSYYIIPWGEETLDLIAGQDFFDASQSAVSLLVGLSIAFIILVACLYVTASNSRRNYYITNYVAVSVVAVFALVVGIVMLALVCNCMSLYYALDWEAYELEKMENHPLGQNPIMFIFGIVLAIVVILDAVALALNLVWKIKLMKGEKELLANGVNKEVV